MKQLYTNRTGDKFACFHNRIDFFGQAMLLTCRLTETDRIWNILLQRKCVYRSCVRWNKTHVRPYFKRCSNFYFLGKSILITSCPFELQTWNPCLIYVNRDNPVLFVIECNVIAVKKRIEGQVWEVSMRTTSLDKECLPSLWAKLHPLLEFAHSLSLLKYTASLKFTWLLTYIKPNENLLPLVIDSLLVKLFPRWKPSYYNTK